MRAFTIQLLVNMLYGDIVIIVCVACTVALNLLSSVTSVDLDLNKIFQYNPPMTYWLKMLDGVVILLSSVAYVRKLKLETCLVAQRIANIVM